jgi:hypothetical protein
MMDESHAFHQLFSLRDWEVSREESGRRMRYVEERILVCMRVVHCVDHLCPETPMIIVPSRIRSGSTSFELRRQALGIDMHIAMAPNRGAWRCWGSVVSY